MCCGRTHLNLQYLYGLRLPEGDGLRRQYSDHGPVWEQGAGKSYQPLCFFPSSHTHVVRHKHGLWSQVNLGSHQAQASHWLFDLGYVA